MVTKAEALSSTAAHTSYSDCRLLSPCASHHPVCTARWEVWEMGSHHS